MSDFVFASTRIHDAPVSKHTKNEIIIMVVLAWSALEVSLISSSLKGGYCTLVESAVYMFD